MRIKEAIARYNEQNPDQPMTQTDLGQKIFKGSRGNRQVKMSQLVSGKTKTIREEWIVAICRQTGVDPNFLLNFKP